MPDNTVCPECGFKGEDYTICPECGPHPITMRAIEVWGGVKSPKAYYDYYIVILMPYGKTIGKLVNTIHNLDTVDGLEKYIEEWKTGSGTLLSWKVLTNVR